MLEIIQLLKYVFYFSFPLGLMLFLGGIKKIKNHVYSCQNVRNKTTAQWSL